MLLFYGAKIGNRTQVFVLPRRCSTTELSRLGGPRGDRTHPIVLAGHNSAPAGSPIFLSYDNARVVFLLYTIYDLRDDGY